MTAKLTTAEKAKRKRSRSRKKPTNPEPPTPAPTIPAQTAWPVEATLAAPTGPEFAADSMTVRPPPPPPKPTRLPVTDVTPSLCPTCGSSQVKPGSSNTTRNDFHGFDEQTKRHFIATVWRTVVCADCPQRRRTRGRVYPPADQKTASHAETTPDLQWVAEFPERSPTRKT